MRYYKLIIALTFCSFIFLQSNELSAQEVNPADQVENVNDDEVIELDAAEINVIVETPQVKLYSNRIKPEFDDVHLDKSFIKEITGEGEAIVFEALERNIDDRRIDVDKMIQKLR